MRKEEVERRRCEPVNGGEERREGSRFTTRVERVLTELAHGRERKRFDDLEIREMMKILQNEIQC